MFMTTHATMTKLSTNTVKVEYALNSNEKFITDIQEGSYIYRGPDGIDKKIVVTTVKKTDMTSLPNARLLQETNSTTDTKDNKDTKGNKDNKDTKENSIVQITQTASSIEIRCPVTGINIKITS